MKIKAKRYILGVRSAALTEMLVFFGLLIIPNILFGDGHRFIDMHPHPFWFILILITVQYGTNEALLCALIASFCLLFNNVPDQYLNETIYDYLLRLSKLPLLWLSSSVIFGQLATRHIDNIRGLKKQLSKAKQYEHSLVIAYDQLKKVKEMLEVRVASQVKGTAAIYESIKSIETMNQSFVLLGLEDIITSILNPKKFSIFALGEKGFEAAVCVGWQDNETYSRRYDTKTPLYQEIANKRTILCNINKSHEKILKKDAVLAAALVDPIKDEIFGMIKIEELDFDKLNLSNIETFKVLCEVVGLAYANAQKYQKINKNSLIHYDTGFNSYSLYESQKEILKSSSAQNISIITLKYKNSDSHTKKAHFNDLVELKKIASDVLPKSSIFYAGKHQEREVMVIIPKATAASTKKHLTKLESLILKKDKDSKIKFSFKIESLKSTNAKRS